MRAWAKFVSVFFYLLLALSFVTWMASLSYVDQSMEFAAFKSAVSLRDTFATNISSPVTPLIQLPDKRDQLKPPERDVVVAITKKTYYPPTAPYNLNSPDLCRGVDPLDVLVVVHTATTHLPRRERIRNTWAARNLIPTRSIRVVFLLGLTNDIKTQALINNEWLARGDIVQGSFKDTYHNLTLKGIMGYRWIQQYCPHAKLILKVDDDMFIDPFLFQHIYFPRYSQSNRTLACHVRPNGTSKIMRTQSKWKVDDYEFRGFNLYPFTYCNGYVLIMTPDIVKALYHASYTTPFFWVDDVYLYGMLPFKVGHVNYESIKTRMTLNTTVGITCYRKTTCKLLSTHAPDGRPLNELWQLSVAQALRDPDLSKLIPGFPLNITSKGL